jgi:hypothetical protein
MEPMKELALPDNHGEMGYISTWLLHYLPPEIHTPKAVLPLHEQSKDGAASMET